MSVLASRMADYTLLSFSGIIDPQPPTLLNLLYLHGSTLSSQANLINACSVFVLQMLLCQSCLVFILNHLLKCCIYHCCRWLLGYPVVYLFGKEHIDRAIYNLSTKSLHIFQIFICRYVQNVSIHFVPVGNSLPPLPPREKNLFII